MKILYLCADLGIPVLGRKGAAVHVRGLVAALIRAGHDVVLAAPVLNKSPWEEPARVDARLLQIPPGAEAAATLLAIKAFSEMLEVERSLAGELRRIVYNRDLATEVKRRFEQCPPDVIYERASLYATAGVAVARELNVPLIVELNAPLALEQSAYRSTALGSLAAQAERWTLSRADTVLAVSMPLSDHAVSLGVDPRRVHVLPNGVDPELFQAGPRDPAARARAGLREGPVVGFVGGLRPWHGVQSLPLLVRRLVRRYPDLQLVVAGDGPLRGDLEGTLKALRLGRNAIFTGALPHEALPELIRQFDIALAPYPRLDHPFYFSPLKVFEYMACGIPVVAARLEQLATVVRDEETGLLYPAGDEDALAEACERLLADAALRERLGSAAAKEVRDGYTWDHNAARITELARALLGVRGTDR